jgi:hypothetical protein
MAQVVNIVVGLSTALIGYTIGRTWQRFISWLHHRRLKRFLAPLLDGGVQVVVSRFMTSDFTEPTGLVGGGDALALRELATIFNEVGYKNYKILYVDEHDVDPRENLILLGGIDTNRLTKEAIELIEPDLLIHDPGPGIKMQIHDLRPLDPPRDRRSRKLSSRKIYTASENTDYGIVIRSRNPFNPNKGLIIIAGAYGYGSWAGATLVREASFLLKCEELDLLNDIRSRSVVMGLLEKGFSSLRNFTSEGKSSDRWAPLECMFKVRIYDDRPLAPEILVFRQMK